MNTEDREESRPRKIIPSIGRRENTDQEGERKPYSQNYNRSDSGNYERKSYNRSDNDDRGGYRSYGNNSSSYGENRPYNRPQKRTYDNSENGGNSGGGYNKPYNRDNNRNNYGSGDRPSYGNSERPSYGNNDRPSYGNSERPSYGNNNRSSYGNSDRPSYGNNDRPSYGNREGGYNNRQSSYGNNRPSYGNNRPSYGNGNSYGSNNDRPYNRPTRPNYDERPRVSPDSSQEGADGASGEVKKRRPRVGDTRVNSYENRGGARPSFGNNRPQQRGGYNNNRGGGYNNNNGGGFKKPQRRTGDYDPNAKYSFQKQLKYKEVLADPNEPIRLNKFLANAGVCSRREADEHIQAGDVKVNDVVITELGTKITRQDIVIFREKQVKIEGKIYIVLNKPKNCVTTSDDPQERLTVMDLVKSACEERIYPVGRLDRNTTGVLLLTNDGDLASKLTHPSFKKKKIYHVWLDKPVAIEDMEKIANGLELEDGEIHADAISYASEDDKAQVGIEIHSGRNRIVRRIFESLGYHVMKLDRVYFAGLTKKNLPRGKWRYLNEREVNALRMGAFE